MNSKTFMLGINKLEIAYNQKFSEEKLKIYWENLKTMNDNQYLTSIKELIRKNKFMPTVSEILIEKNMNNMNLNSSFWYSNLRQFCDKEKVPYYDITKGQNYILEPYYTSKKIDNKVVNL